MAAHRDTEVVEQAFQMALLRRHPAAGLLHPSDRGSHYSSGADQSLLGQFGVQVSMSGKGDCSDNAAMASFIRSRKAVSGRTGMPTKLLRRRSGRSLSPLKSSPIASVVMQRWAI